MEVSGFLHLALPEEQWLPAISGALHQFVEEERYVHERQPCWYLGKGCQTRLYINTGGMQATFIDGAGERKWTVDSTTDCARRFMAHPQMEGCRVYGQVGLNLAVHVRGITFSVGEWSLLTLTVPREEFIFEKGNVTVYADSADGCRRLCEWIKEVGVVTQNAPLTVDITLNGEVYKQQVARVVVEIRRGKYIKVTVQRAIPLPSRIDMPAMLLYGRQANAPMRSFMFHQERRKALGFGPGLVMSVTGNKVVTEPLAGIHDRMGDPEYSKAKEAELLYDSKEVFEYTLSVKEAIAELEAVCQPGSMVIENLVSIHQRGSVQHLRSGVGGQLTENKDAWDALTVLFPLITTLSIPENAALNATM